MNKEHEPVIDQARRLLRPVDPDKHEPTIQQVLEREYQRTGIRYVPVNREEG